MFRAHFYIKLNMTLHTRLCVNFSYHRDSFKLNEHFGDVYELDVPFRLGWLPFGFRFHAAYLLLVIRD